MPKSLKIGARNDRSNFHSPIRVDWCSDARKNKKNTIQGIDRTLADKVFAICDYYLQGKTAKHSRHLYDIYKLLPLVLQDEKFRQLIQEVRAVRAQSVVCPSAQPEVNISDLLLKIINEKAYKQDYDVLTSQLLEEPVPYNTAVKALEQIAASHIF